MADEKKQPTMRDIYRERSKLLDKEVQEHIKNSEKSGNTLDSKHFDTYLRDMVNSVMSAPTGLPEDDNTVVTNTLYNHAQIELKSDYKDSLRFNPRTPNNKMPVAVSKEWEKTAKNELKEVRGGIRKRAREILSQSVDTGRTPSQQQYKDYLKGQLGQVISAMPQEYQDYVRAYTEEWIDTTASDMYDTDLKLNPRNVTNDFPWTKQEDKPSNKSSGLSSAMEKQVLAKALSQPMTEYGDTYRSFSGHDMVCTIDMPMPDGSNIVKVIGALQTVTYSIHDEKVPIRCIGDMNAKGYVFGPRTIAGTLIFSVFDKHWAHFIMKEYLANKRLAAHFLADELPPFNMTISCANEYGYNARLAIYGITLVNEGQVMSINDVYTENTYQFYALDVDYLSDVVSKASNKISKSENLPVTTKDGSTGNKVIYLDALGDISGDVKPSDKVSQSTDPDKPVVKDSNYYFKTPKEIMYSQIAESRNQTNDELLEKYNSDKIDEAEFRRLMTKNEENYKKRMEDAAAYYEKNSKKDNKDKDKKGDEKKK